MCLSIPSKVVELDEQTNVATVDTMGVKRVVSLDLISEPVELDDYVLIHVGFAMNKISKEEALSSLEVYEEIVQKMQAEDERQDAMVSTA